MIHKQTVNSKRYTILDPSYKLTMESGTQVRISESLGGEITLVEAVDLESAAQDNSLLHQSVSTTPRFIVLTTNPQMLQAQPQELRSYVTSATATADQQQQQQQSTTLAAVATARKTPQQQPAVILQALDRHQALPQQSTSTGGGVQVTPHQQNVVLLGRLALQQSDGRELASTERNSAAATTTTPATASSGEQRQILLVQAVGSNQDTQDSINIDDLRSEVQNDGDVRHESASQALYSAIQYVPAEFSPADMLYTSSSTGSAQGHPNVHQLQSGATYAVYQAEGTYSPHVSYYQNSSLTYQPQAVLHSIPNTPYALSGHTTGAGIGLQEDDSTPQSFNHTTRASPATIQWLLHNYETAEGVSLPRCTLYGHYLKHCSENRLDPVNAASFGKLIRSVFLGLRTRRLGTRGNSKYHYYGIRIKPDSPLNRISEDSLTMAMRQQPTNAARRAKLQMSQGPASPTSATPTIQSNAVSVISRANGIQSQQHNLQAAQPQLHLQQQQPNFAEVNAAVSATEILISGSNTSGAGVAPNVAPPGGNESFVMNTVITEVARPSLTCLEPQLERVGLTVGHAELFFMNYRNHCEELFDCVRNQLFGEVDKCWRRFWQVTDNGSVDSYDDESNDAMNDDGLNRTQLYTLCIMPEILKYIQSMDFQYYQVMVNVLIPNVLKPIPNTLTQSMRSFAKRLESSLAEILQGAPEVVVRVKLDAVSTLAQAFRRYTSLNHLAQTVRGVLQNSNHISQMLADLNRVDFRNVHEQASWVCYCDPVKVDEIERSFKSALQSQKNLEHLADWSNSIVNQILAEYCEKPIGQLIHVSRQFLLKWCFYSSLVMRDLTLRSATSFGSFHLIRLLLDEYMFYLVEQLVSRTEQQTTLAIMSQSYRYRTCPDPAFYENFFLYRNQNNNSTNQIDAESSSSNNERRPINSLLADQYPNSQNTINNASGLFQGQTSRQCDMNQNEIRTNSINNDHQANRRESDQNSLLQQGRFGSMEVNASAARMTENFSPVESNESTKEAYCSANSNEENSYFVSQKSQQPLQKCDHLHQKQPQGQMTTLCLPIADNRFTQENVIVGGGDDDGPSVASPSSGGEGCRAAKYFVAAATGGAAAVSNCVYQQQQQIRTGSDADHILGPVVKRAKME